MTAETGHPGMTQEYVALRPIRNLTRPAGINRLHNLACTAPQYSEDPPISGQVR